MCSLQQSGGWGTQSGRTLGSSGPPGKLDRPDEPDDYGWARHANVPAIPPLAHPDEEVRAWFTGEVMARDEVWLAVRDGTVVGILVLSPGWIEQLYVAPGHTGAGIGATLLERAKALGGPLLDLWTFQSNVGARRFYQRHGFVEVDRTAGDNIEGAPDVRYRWVG
jgi:GNAT superfamily N-acetyltransferase